MSRGFLFALELQRRSVTAGEPGNATVTDCRYRKPFMSEHQGYMKALKCRECGREYPLTATHVCEFDFGPLEVAYDYDRIKKSMTRAAIEPRPKSMWRYRELLPVAKDPTVGLQAGFTPLIKADRLAKKLGMRELWIKNDAVDYPTLSFKDRVVSVALSRSRELGFDTVACASTGNLANSVAGQGRFRRLESLRIHPLGSGTGQNFELAGFTAPSHWHQRPLRRGQPSVRRDCRQFGWAFVNVNMRPYYAEGSKSMAYEIAEQFGWRIPRHTVVPMASGSLLTKIQKGYQEFIKLGLVAESKYDVHGAQATGCSPISVAQKAGLSFRRTPPARSRTTTTRSN